MVVDGGAVAHLTLLISSNDTKLKRQVRTMSAPGWNQGCIHSLDWTGITGILDWTGILDRTTGLEYWTGLLDWNTGLDYWSGLLDWNTGLDYWTGILDWTTGLEYWTGLEKRYAPS